MPNKGKINSESLKKWLANPTYASWLAYVDGEAIAYIRIQRGNSDAAYIVNDKNTASIIGAFTKKDFRSSGIATALLNHAINWARSRGFQRCSVDFESQNIPGSRFWLKYFRPVCYSMIRHIDKRITLAQNKDDRNNKE